MYRIAALCVCLGLVGVARAEEDLEIQPGAFQSDFRAVSEDIIATIEYKALGPAEAGGWTGFEVAAFGAYVPTENEESWKRLTGQDVEELGLVGVRVQKGLPFNIDVGAFYSGVPEYGVGIYGAEVRYAILPGSTVMPAFAIRGTYDELHGLDDFDLRSYSVDASISKGFAFLTPYAGAGYVWGVSEPKGTIAELSGLERENIKKAKFFAGVRIALALLRITPEFEQVGSNQSFNLLVGIGF
jgi:hypothetical protein